MTTVTCTACGRSYATAPHLLGKTVSCPNCGVSLFIPAKDGKQQESRSRTTVTCASCGQSYAAAPHLLGKTISCPKCTATLSISAGVDAPGQRNDELATLANLLEGYSPQPISKLPTNWLPIANAKKTHKSLPYLRLIKPAIFKGLVVLGRGLVIFGKIVVSIVVIVALIAAVALVKSAIGDNEIVGGRELRPGEWRWGFGGGLLSLGAFLIGGLILIRLWLGDKNRDF